MGSSECHQLTRSGAPPPLARPWRRSRHVDLEAAPGEYSYPALTAWPAGGGGGEGFTLTYTWNRRRVVLVSMGLEEFRAVARP